MPYRDMFTNDIYENEHDEEMTRKHPNYYKALKTFFPEAYKLPEEEIKPMLGIMKTKGETYEDAVSHLQSYITDKLPRWGEYLKPLAHGMRELNNYTNMGEMLADNKIAYDQYKQMKKTNNKLIGKYGRNVGAAAGTDDYYHPLLQCELAKISPYSKNNGLALGYAKEVLLDYPKKTWENKLSQKEIWDDIQKDLKNNAYGSNLGSTHPNRSCYEMLDEFRTRNMKNEGIY